MMDDNLLICVGVIIAPHGVKGNLKVKSYTATPSDIAKYKLFWDENGQPRYIVRQWNMAGNTNKLTLEGVIDRDEAQKLIGTKLYIAREQLPKIVEEEEFYHVDLIGLKIIDTQGNLFGTVKAIHNFGAGDMVEVIIHATKTTEYFPFTKEYFPQINLKEQFIVIDENET